MLSLYERGLVLEAISRGMNIVNGLHEFLNDDPVFKAACVVSTKPEQGHMQDNYDLWQARKTAKLSQVHKIAFEAMASEI